MLKRYQSKSSAPLFYAIFTHPKKKFHAKVLTGDDYTELIGTTKGKRRKNENKEVLFIVNIYLKKIIANIIFLNCILEESK